MQQEKPIGPIQKKKKSTFSFLKFAPQFPSRLKISGRGIGLIVKSNVLPELNICSDLGKYQWLFEVSFLN